MVSLHLNLVYSSYHLDVVEVLEMTIAVDTVVVVLYLVVTTLFIVGEDVVTDVALEVEGIVIQGIDVLITGSPRLELTVAGTAAPRHRRRLGTECTYAGDL